MAQNATDEPLKRTPFHDKHLALNAKMVPFAGFEMPVQYPSGITAEHRAVRERCGLFDVSHMGEFMIRGPQALDFLNAVTTNDVAALVPGQAHYSAILYENGTFVDDCLVYRFPDYYMLVVNASNAAKDLAHISNQLARFDATVEDVSSTVALLALQGPNAAAVLQKLTGTDLSTISYYHFAEGSVAGVPAVISRTGYTGEDGFELYFNEGQAARVWDALTGGTDEVTPCGLGCRDSLRLEMGMALYGNDIDDSVTPLEANLGWIVKMKKGDFTGREALEAQKTSGVKRKLVGFTMPERTFPRHGYPVFIGSEASGVVCSGTLSPTLGIAIGTCYLPTEHCAEGTVFSVEIRGKLVDAKVVKMPFLRKARV